MRGVTQFDSIVYGFPAEIGRLRVAAKGMVWRGNSSKRAVTLFKEHVSWAEWYSDESRQLYQLVVGLSDQEGTAVKVEFEGFTRDGYSKLAALFDEFYDVLLVGEDVSLDGKVPGSSELEHGEETGHGGRINDNASEAVVPVKLEDRYDEETLIGDHDGSNAEKGKGGADSSNINDVTGRDREHSSAESDLEDGEIVETEPQAVEQQERELTAETETPCYYRGYTPSAKSQCSESDDAHVWTGSSMSGDHASLLSDPVIELRNDPTKPPPVNLTSSTGPRSTGTTNSPHCVNAPSSASLPLFLPHVPSPPPPLETSSRNSDAPSYRFNGSPSPHPR